jgi:hypothetical protein
MHIARLPAAAVLAAALLAVPAADAAVSAGAYKGKTDQNRAVTFKVKKGKVVAFQAGVMTFCNTMGANRFQTDAVANVPDMKVKGNGRFKWSGDTEDDGTIEVSGRITGSKAKGKVTLSRPDSNYDASEGVFRFGSCAANDRAWTAKLR